MISEYALGAHGWVIAVFFLSCALSSATLAAALLPGAVTRTAKVGLGFLVLAVVGLVLGGLFPIDPVTTSHDALSFSGRMHGVGFMVGVPSELFAVLLLSLSARRGSRQRPFLLALACAVWLSVLVMVPLIARGHGFGIPNRTFMIFYVGWLVLAAVPTAARPRGDGRRAMLVSPAA